MVALSLVVLLFGGLIRNVANRSMRQLTCPPEMLGRMNAAARWLTFGPLPVGALMGGALGESLGLWPAPAATILGLTLGPVALRLSPIRHGRRLPTTSEVEMPVTRPRS
ncbi:hypothetical protein AB0J63_19960 [Streptosporangium canum]|uniref:hypothetical protein n=1 Tax=Streptosporangium canum TaxID=324952 RepID=UPI003426E081